MYNKYTNNVCGEDWGLLYVDYASQLVYSHILVHNAITFVLEYGVIFV